MVYSSRIKRLKKLGSKKWEIHLKAKEKLKLGEEVIELTIGEPDVATPKVLIEECYKSMNFGRTKYSNGRGEENLLNSLTRKYNSRAALEITKENIICFPGAQTALYATINALVAHGDLVLVGDPYYATYEGIIVSAGAKLRSVPIKAENNFILKADDLASRITKNCKVLLLNNPHNPTGAVMTNRDFLNLEKICLENNIWIVCDEVYEELIFRKSFSSPLNIRGLARSSIVISSISKTYSATGFRSGWVVGPKTFCDILLPFAEIMLFGNQPFIADMTALALEMPSLVSTKMAKAYEQRAKLICESLSKTPLISPLMPDSGMFILIDVSETNFSSFEFADGLLQTKNVAVMPGSSFGKEANNFIRLSLSVPDRTLIKACHLISDFVRENCEGAIQVLR